MGASDHAPRPRIQNLSDLVFGLALSISALTLIGHQPTTTEGFIASLGAYAFSFLILISLWQSYSSVTSLLPSETTILVDLNVVLLFLVSVEPYLFNELFSAEDELLTYVSGAYSVDLTAMFIILAFFLQTLTKEEKHLVPKALLGRYRARRDFVVVGALVLGLSIYPDFGTAVVATVTTGGQPYNFTLRSTLWLVALLLSWIGRFATSLRHRDDAETARE